MATVFGPLEIQHLLVAGLLESGNFEDMMSRFKQTSDEKISDLKRGNDTRRGYSRRGQQK